MFDVNGKDNSTYNVDNFEFIKKTSPIVGGLIEKEYNRQKTTWSSSLPKTTAQRRFSRRAAVVSRGNTRRAILMCVPPVIRAVTMAEQSL